MVRKLTGKSCQHFYTVHTHTYGGIVVRNHQRTTIPPYVCVQVFLGEKRQVDIEKGRWECIIGGEREGGNCLESAVFG